MYKSGFVGIVGRPNVGKSTLLNCILKEQIAIESPLPQTTQQEIKGIYSTDEGQIVFVDTPGIHKTNDSFGKIVNSSALKTINDPDIDFIIYLLDVSRHIGEEENYIKSFVEQSKTESIIVFNKCDVTKNYLEDYKELFSSIDNILEISALNNKNVDKLISFIFENLPEGPQYYDPEQITDKNMRFIMSEILRKQIIINFKEEVPHATTIRINKYIEDGDDCEIEADIIVETQGQKKMIIGTGAKKLKMIKHFAKREFRQFVNGKINLSLFVKVIPKWRKNSALLKELGFPVK
jgi:GTPase